MTHVTRMTQHCWLVAGMAVAVVLAGCTTTETVMMQHPQTHEIAPCADAYRRFIDGQGYRTQEECIADYQRKGYERVRGAWQVICRDGDSRGYGRRRALEPLTRAAPSPISARQA